MIAAPVDAPGLGKPDEPVVFPQAAHGDGEGVRRTAAHLDAADLPGDRRRAPPPTGPSHSAASSFTSRIGSAYGSSSTRFGDLLETARQQRFVGRRREPAGFDDALAGRSPRRVLFVHGQGGIGKTTLLWEFRSPGPRGRPPGRRSLSRSVGRQ